ncbi:MAG: DICT sensory domain-containing protein [Chloroflexota bacterium]
MAQLSIFQTLQDKIGDELPIVQLTKATLVHLSHTLEDFVLTKHLPAMMFTGFQESSHWRKETERYQQMADSQMQDGTAAL